MSFKKMFEQGIPLMKELEEEIERQTKTKSLIKRAAATVVGAAGGALMGVMVTPVYMIGDVFAPVTYPVAGTFLGGLIANITMNNEIAGAAIGLAGGVAAIPLATFNFISRPVLMPTAQAITFGVIAYQQTK